MKKDIWIIVLLLIIAVSVGLFYSHKGAAESQGASKVKRAKYYCSMHPDYVSDKPGSCPICGMDLVKIKSETKDIPAIDPPVKNERKLLYYRNPMDPSITSPTFMKDSMGMDYIPVYKEEPSTTEVLGVRVKADKQQLIGVKIGIVQKRDLTLEIRASGRVAFDPDLYVAQTGFVEALKTLKNTENDSESALNEQSKSLVEASRRKLYLQGMSDAEIDELAKSGKADDNLYYSSSSQTAWIYVAVYENEAPVIKPGEKVTFETPAFAGKAFHGTVVGISPVLDAQTRTVRLRVKVDDQAKQLRPEVFGTATILVNLGEKLAVDQDAVLDSGQRQIVHVIHDGDIFELREVTLGMKVKDYYEVLNGLKEGEKVVVSGNFLIDAESRLEGSAKAFKQNQGN